MSSHLRLRRPGAVRAATLRLPLAVLAIGLPLALGACGSASESAGGSATNSAATPKATTKATPSAPWTELASDRCATFLKEQTKVREKYSAPDIAPDEAVEGALHEGMSVMAALVGDLREIDVPDDAQQVWTSWLEGVDQTVETMPIALQQQISGTENEGLEKIYTEIGDKVLPAQERYDLGACEKLSEG